jgi:hypothetical protein
VNDEIDTGVAPDAVIISFPKPNLDRHRVGLDTVRAAASRVGHGSMFPAAF